MKKIKIQAIDCYRHDYWKVSIQLLCDLKIINGISIYSFLGNGNTPLNEKGYAYLEIDEDCKVFDTAIRFFNKTYTIDFVTLQEEFDKKYQDYDEWLEELDRWDTNILEKNGYTWDFIPDDLLSLIVDDNDDEDEDYEDYE